MYPNMYIYIILLGIRYTKNHNVGSTSAHVVCGNSCSIQICTLVAHLLFEKLASYLIANDDGGYCRIVMLKILVTWSSSYNILTKYILNSFVCMYIICLLCKFIKLKKKVDVHRRIKCFRVFKAIFIKNNNLNVVFF